ncbi:MAG: FmdB family zinc ribbon protein [Planctomycetota bacterium]|jgi:putative FmdB family regulatory protein
MILYEWRCTDASCNTKFDRMTKMSQTVTVCPECGGQAKRLISAATLDYRMGVDPDFGTMGDKWAKRLEERGKEAARRKQEHGDEI